MPKELQEMLDQGWTGFFFPSLVVSIIVFVIYAFRWYKRKDDAVQVVAMSAAVIIISAFGCYYGRGSYWAEDTFALMATAGVVAVILALSVFAFGFTIAFTWMGLKRIFKRIDQAGPAPATVATRSRPSRPSRFRRPARADNANPTATSTPARGLGPWQEPGVGGS